MKLLHPLALVLCLLGVLPAKAEALRPFVPGSAQALRDAHADRPFVLALWSLTCSHCQEELALLGRLKEKYPALDLALVSTDTPEDAETLNATLARHGLVRAEAWVFADPFTELLRQEIDPRWSGELPRTYLHNRDRSVRAVSGRLTAEKLEHWIAEQYGREPPR